MPGMGERWAERALTSCPGHDPSLPPPTSSCLPGFQRSSEAGDLGKGAEELCDPHPTAACWPRALPSNNAEQIPLPRS